MKKIKLIWKKIKNKAWNKKRSEKNKRFDLMIEIAKLELQISNIKEDLQKIIDKDGFMSDIQEYINEL